MEQKPNEQKCANCGATVFAVPGHFGKDLLVERGKIEIAYKIVSYGSYTTTSGWKIHKCQQKETV